MLILLKLFCKNGKLTIHSTLVLPNILRWSISESCSFSGVLAALYIKSTETYLCSDHSTESLCGSCSADAWIAQLAAALLFRMAAAWQRVLLRWDRCDVDSEAGSILQQGVFEGVIIILMPHWSMEHSTKQD